MPNTVNSYMVTDLGNVSPNPRGEYNATYDYEYLDLVYYKGGSYVCLAPLGETIANVAPIAGQTTTNWQCVAIPGDITPEYISMYNEVVNDYNETNTNTANVAQMKDSAYASMTAAQESENKAGASEVNARASEVSAKQSMDKAHEYADDAMRSNNDTQELVSGFDERVATAISNAETSISESTENAKDEIIAQKSSSLNEFRTDAETVMTNEKNVAVAEIHNIVDDFDIATDAKEQEVIALANEKIDVMTALKNDTVNAKNAAETAATTAVEKASEAATYADNSKRSENAVTEMKISIEQSQSDIQTKQIQVSSDAQQVSSDKSDILIMKSSIEDTAEKVNIDVKNGLKQISDSKDNSIVDIQNKKNEVIADIEQYGALQVSNEEPISENVDLWINPDSEEEYSVPEIKDGEVNASDTWSSEKIFGEISELKSDLGELDSRLSESIVEISETFESKNLFNPNDAVEGTISTTGEIKQSTYTTSGFIPVKPNDSLFAYHILNGVLQTTARGFYTVAHYDSNKNFLSRTGSIDVHEYTVPPDVYYIRFTYPVTYAVYKNVIMVTKNEEVSEFFEYFDSYKTAKDPTARSVAEKALSKTETKVNTKVIDCFGDSRTEMIYEQGTSFTQYLNILLGSEYSVNNYGESSQSSGLVCVRLGSNEMFLAMNNNKIPSSGANNAVKLKFTSGNDRNVYEYSGSRYAYGSISGVPVRFSRTGIADNTKWLVERLSDGVEVPVHELTKFVPADTRSREHVCVLWFGKNDFATATSFVVSGICDNYDKAVEYLGHDKFIILGETCSLTSTYEVGGSDRNKMEQINTYLSDKYPDNFIDINAYLSSAQALSDVGLTPTSADDTNMAKGFPCESLMVHSTDSSDTVHQNEKGREAIAKKIHSFMVSKGWV